MTAVNGAPQCRHELIAQKLCACCSTRPTLRHGSNPPKEGAAPMNVPCPRMNDVQFSYRCAPARRTGCDMCAPVANPPELPEQLAPTGPKHPRFRVVPSALRPTLLPDEARIALRLSVLTGCAEFAAWAWFAQAGDKGALLGWAALRLLKPIWAWTGTRFPRPTVAFLLLLLALFGGAASVLTVAQLFAVAPVRGARRSLHVERRPLAPGRGAGGHPGFVPAAAAAARPRSPVRCAAGVGRARGWGNGAAAGVVPRLVRLRPGRRGRRRVMNERSFSKEEGDELAGGAHVLDGPALHAGAPALPQDAARVRR